MRRSFLLLSFALGGALVSGAGCSSSLRGSASHLAADDPGKAAEAAQARLSSHPDDPRALRDLGIAYYRMGRAADALAPLDRALALRADDRAALLFRARSLDSLRQVSPAIEAYAAYVARARGRDRETAQARIEQLRRIRMRSEVAQSLARESKLDVAAIPSGTVAVSDFSNPAESDTLRPLAKGLAVMLVTDLSQVRGLKVLERQRIGTLLAEIELTHGGRPGASDRSREAAADPGGTIEPVTTIEGQQRRLAALRDGEGRPHYEGPIDGVAGPGYQDAVRSFQASRGLTVDGIAGPQTQTVLEEDWRSLPPSVQATPRVAAASAFDPRTAPRIGRLLGAHDIVHGSVIGFGPRRVRLAADLLDVPSGEVTGSTPPVEGEIEDVLRLQKDLFFDVVEGLGVTLTKEERKALDVEPTKNFDAFLAFCHGIDLEDQGRASEALVAYRRAFALDSGFSMAREAAGALAVGSEDLGSLDRGTIESLPGPDGSAEWASSIGQNVGLAPSVVEQPGIDVSTPETVREGGEGRGSIVIRGNLPDAGRSGRR
jgi:TolB-like protein